MIMYTEDSQSRWISELLGDKITNNILLILELIEEHSPNPTLLSYLTAICFKHNDPDIHAYASILLERDAPEDFSKVLAVHWQHLNRHLDRYGRVQLTPYWLRDSLAIYNHPAVHFLDAVFAEKMVQYHIGWGARHDWDTLVWKDDNYNMSLNGLRRMCFLKNIYLSNIQNFDFQSFWNIVQHFDLRVLHFMQVQNLPSLLPFWQLPTLEELDLTAVPQGMVLKIPNLDSISLKKVRLVGKFEFKNLDRLLVHANRIEIEIAKL